MIDINQTLLNRVPKDYKEEEDINKKIMNRQEDILFPEYVRPNDTNELIRNTMIYCGNLGSFDALPKIYKTGYTYKVVVSGKHADIDCISGDLICAINTCGDPSKSKNSDWAVLRSNRIKNSEGRPGYFYSDIAEKRDIIIGKDTDIRIGGDRDGDITNYRGMMLNHYSKMLTQEKDLAGLDPTETIYIDDPKYKTPMIIGGSEQIASNILTKSYKDILDALAKLAAQPSTDPYKGANYITGEDENIINLRSSIKGD